MKVYESIVTDDIMAQFQIPRGRSLMNHAANTTGIEQTLAVSALFWPKLVEVEGCVFIEEFFYNGQKPEDRFRRLMEQFHEDKRHVEWFTNAWSLADFFFTPDVDAVDNDTLITAFGEVLQFFWTMRLKTLFPERDFVVELGDAIAGERGLTITFYQKHRA